LSGIIHVKHNDLRWQDAPREYGPYKTLYTRWKRWKDQGVFTRMLAELSGDVDEHAAGTVDASWLQALQAPKAG
jgi:transposase